MRERRWARSYPAQGLGLSGEEIEAVLRMYRLPPEQLGADDLSFSSAPFERLLLEEHHRLHVWALGVLDAERAVVPVH
jgi:hypothetical protein